MTMVIRLHRKWCRKGYSIGLLYVDGKHICETLEDEDRGLTSDMTEQEVRRIKVKGETAIPLGTYDVALTFSPRFNRVLPLLMDVKGFTGIRIHSGNRAKDTEGCILCGKNTVVGEVTNSRYWSNRVKELIERAIVKRHEKVKIIIYR